MIKKRIRLKHTQITSVILIVAFFSCLLYYLWFYKLNTYTNYAFVSANVIPIRSRTSGLLTHVYAKKNQFVKKGDKLFQIDPTPYVYALNKATAKLKLVMHDQKIFIQSTDAAKALVGSYLESVNMIRDQRSRATPLIKKHTLSEETGIDLQFKLKKAQALLKNAEDNVYLWEDKLQRLQSEIKIARAELNIAKYNLAQTTVYAPANGWVTNFHLETGEYINKGHELFAFIESKSWWIVARFKETALKNIHLGDRVKVKIDMFPDHTFYGKVSSIEWGINRTQSNTGMAKSALLYVKPTEHWIRLAQRFPVFITLNHIPNNYHLRIGANASVMIIK